MFCARQKDSKKKKICSLKMTSPEKLDKHFLLSSPKLRSPVGVTLASDLQLLLCKLAKLLANSCCSSSVFAFAAFTFIKTFF